MISASLEDTNSVTTTLAVPQISNKSTTASPTDAGLRELIKKQKANGSFDISSLVSVIPSASLDAVNKSLSSSSLPTTELAQSLLITAIICAYMEVKFKENSTSWSLVVKKAKSWIKKEAEKANITADWDALASKFLSK